MTEGWVWPQLTAEHAVMLSATQQRCQELSHGLPVSPVHLIQKCNKFWHVSTFWIGFLPLSTFKAQPQDWLAELTCKNAYLSWVFKTIHAKT